MFSAFFGIKIMDELRGFNEEKLWRKMFMDNGEFEDWLKDLGLLHRRSFCCDKGMNLCTPRAGENWGLGGNGDAVAVRR